MSNKVATEIVKVLQSPTSQQLKEILSLSFTTDVFPDSSNFEKAYTLTTSQYSLSKLDRNTKKLT